MQIRQWKLCLIFLSLFFLWQVTLIILNMKEELIGIDSKFFQFKSKQNSSGIPRLIHQTWKSVNLSNYPINNSHSEWRRVYHDYEIRLWTDDDLRRLIRQNYSKKLYQIYESFSYSIQRADLARLIVLHHQGGIYADLDVFPCSRAIENLRRSNASFIIPRSSTGSSLMNYFLLAERSSPVLDYIFQRIVPNSALTTVYILPYLRVFSKGTLFLTRVMRNYIKLDSNEKRSLWILSEDEVTRYVDHHKGRSWHQLDGIILNRINIKVTLFICLLVVFLLFKYRSFIANFFEQSPSTNWSSTKFCFV